MANKRGPGFHHVALKVYDFDASMKFYQEGLGFTRAYGWGEGDSRAAMLDTGDGNYVELFAGGKKPGEPGTGIIFHYAIRVADTDAAYARALAAGAAVQSAPNIVDIQGDRVVRVKIAFVYGPDGESIEFFENDEL
jgi:glyoxylase I family protein